MVPRWVAKPTRSMTGMAHPGEDAGAAVRRRAPGLSADELMPGAILAGKYRLISEIGRGGMGSVWRAEHLGWEAPVALKLMNSDISAHPEAIARFEREVRLAAGLRSPHVVQVLDHGVDDATGTPFIAMELLEGESLARRLKRSPLSPAETFHVFSELVRALTRAHAAGIVHRDLKPDNVFLVKNDEESHTKVLDFGVAKWMAPDPLESGLTRPGSVVGTPYYMSPEQIQGSREIDHRADLWALAAIACECLTGRRPFEAPDFAQLAVLLLGNRGRPLPSELGPVPPGFDAWFLRATDPDISQRFQSAREMAQALAPICEVAPPSASEPYPSGRVPISTHDVASMAGVSNTAAELLFSPSLWQRPMARLVITTVAATLVVTGGLFYWIASRSWRTNESAKPPIATSAPKPPVAPPATTTTGPNIRPIRATPQAPVSRPELSVTPSTPDGARSPGADGRARRDELARERFGGYDQDRTVSHGSDADRDSIEREEIEREELRRRVRAAKLERNRARAKPRCSKWAVRGRTAPLSTSSSKTSPSGARSRYRSRSPFGDQSGRMPPSETSRMCGGSSSSGEPSRVPFSGSSS